MFLANQMNTDSGRGGRITASALALVAIIVSITFLVCLTPTQGVASVALERDRVQGDTFTVFWSPGIWSQSGAPIAGCETFPSGTSTGPGDTTDADSLICGSIANGWNWSVTVPGGYTINWGMTGLPPGIEICAQIFYFVGRPGLLDVSVDVPRDWMVVKNEQGEILYAGSFEGFYPLRLENVVVTEARRCGLLRVLPTGACCFADGHCEYLPEAQCAGVWLGPESVCDPNPCPQPPGACCFPDGHCEYLPEGQCTGAWLGAESVCDPNPCPPPPGACCFPDGHCEYLPEGQCAGAWQGVGSVCEPNPCPPPDGACCFEDGTCQVLTESECVQVQGNWQGVGTDCDPNECPPVPVEQRSWGRIKAIYR